VSSPVPEAPSDHLLRTLAAERPTARVLELGCGRGRHALPLALLGFDLWACDADPEAVAATRDALATTLGEAAAHRVTRARPAALGYPDDHFDWVVAYGAYDSAPDAAALFDALAETRRVLKPGGWVFAAFRQRTAGPDLTPDTLAKLFSEAHLALAEAPAVEDHGEPVVRGIFRKVTDAVRS